jgi:hypothetical protein
MLPQLHALMDVSQGTPCIISNHDLLFKLSSQRRFDCRIRWSLQYTPVLLIIEPPLPSRATSISILSLSRAHFSRFQLTRQPEDFKYSILYFCHLRNSNLSLEALHAPLIDVMITSSGYCVLTSIWILRLRCKSLRRWLPCAVDS